MEYHKDWVCGSDLVELGLFILLVKLQELKYEKIDGSGASICHLSLNRQPCSWNVVPLQMSALLISLLS